MKKASDITNAEIKIFVLKSTIDILQSDGNSWMLEYPGLSEAEQDKILPKIKKEYDRLINSLQLRKEKLSKGNK